ncbi:Gfo/Idh/MocA family protein [Alkalihalobacillus pseudalcaliphilus]|uniref:Gfo/Idh/MocA family protein n=1 Tax=Alkalihalobacillus pseudalcaliphilus TaxID=79884 RepID=UPI00064DE555|nr:Gfo/Idh/MocA family oxidoreductase [Alkalihalobacillus pseudalcaliphilus]KMK75368.1 oxidoreductase [Alkalihalobacillus pseudalcaliphilus]
MIKVVIIGLGTISDMHAKSYIANPEAELYGVCDVNKERAHTVATKYKIQKVYMNADEVFADPNVEAVSICTWNHTHAELAIAAIRAGKHVLVEKPVAMTVKEAEEIKAAVDNSNVMLQVGYVRRFAENAQVLKAFIDQGKLGDIYYAKASLLRRIGNPGGWFADKERSGGGPLIDLGVHIIDACWYLMGRPKVKSVTGHVYSSIGNRSNIQNLDFYKTADYDASVNSVEDLANALITFENGSSLMVDTSYSLHLKKDQIALQLFGTKGGAELEPHLTLVTEENNTIINIDPQINQSTFDFDGAFQNQINAFIGAIQSNGPSPAPIEDGVELMKMIEGIYQGVGQKDEVKS